MIILRATSQRGLSLIEIMVALLLSSLLILGVTQIYIDNKANYVFQQGQSGNNEDARYTLLILEEELRRTGYRIQPDTQPLDADDQDFAFRAEMSGDCNFEQGQVITYNADDQRICLRYQPFRDPVVSCDGVTHPGPPNPYEINAAVSNIIVELVFNDGELLCNGAAITGNLADLKFEFGIANQDSREASTYTATPSATDDDIQSVRYAALLRSRFSNIADSTDSLAYAAWRSQHYNEADATAPDRALYLMTENTINLRNLTR